MTERESNAQGTNVLLITIIFLLIVIIGGGIAFFAYQQSRNDSPDQDIRIETPAPDQPAEDGNTESEPAPSTPDGGGEATPPAEPEGGAAPQGQTQSSTDRAPDYVDSL